MTVTVNTDASFHPKLRVGAFAFWIVCSRGRLIQSGPLKNPQTAHDAELQCIGNALYALLNGNFPAIVHIYVNTDCKYAIESIEKGKHIGRSADTVSVIHDLIKKLKIKNGFSSNGRFKKFISWRYVPGHTSGRTKRTWVNNKMDELAKQALYRMIKSTNK